MNTYHLRRLSEILGHKWDLVILVRIAERPLRYMEIANQVRNLDSDLTEGVLSKNLRRLTTNGLVRRDVADGHHVYDLTTRGRHIVRVLESIGDIDGEVPAGRPAPDRSQETVSTLDRGGVVRLDPTQPAPPGR